MNTIADWALQNSLMVAGIGSMVWLYSRVRSRRPGDINLLWVLLLIKLVTPPLAPLTISSDWLKRPPVQDAIVQEAVDPVAMNAVPMDDFTSAALPLPEVRPDVFALADGAPSLSNPAPLVVAASHEPVIAKPIPWSQWAVELLLIGTVMIVGLTVRRLAQLAGVIRRSVSVDEGFQRRVDLVADGMLRRSIVVRRSGEISSPCVSCLGRPLLLWPASLACDGDEAHPVIAHELAHVARRDHWVAWLELPVLWACWWNPVFWMVRHQLHETRELACDALSLASLPERRRVFAEALLRLSHGPKSVNLAVSMVETGFAARSSLRRRLQMVFDSKVSGRRSVAGIGLAGLLAAAVLPGLSVGQDAPPTTDASVQPLALPADAAPQTESAALPLAAPAADAASSSDLAPPVAEAAPRGLPKPAVAAVKPSADVVEAKPAVAAVPPVAGLSSATDAALAPPVAENRRAATRATTLAEDQVRADGSQVLRMRVMKGDETILIVRKTRDGQMLLDVVSSDGSRAEYKISDAETVETKTSQRPETPVGRKTLAIETPGQAVFEEGSAQGGAPQLHWSTNGPVKESVPANPTGEGLEERREDLELAKLNVEEKLVELESAQAENAVSADQSTIRKVKLAELGVKRAKVEMNRAARALHNAEASQQQPGLQRM